MLHGRGHAQGHGDGTHAVRPGDLAARPHGRLGIAPQAHEPGVGQELPAPGHPGAQRPFPAPAGHGHLDDAGVQLAQRLVAEPEPLHDPHAEVLHHHLGPFHQPPKQFLALVMPQVQGDAELGPVHVGMGGAAPAPGRHRVGLDLEHLHAVIAQDLGAQGAGELLCQIGHA